MKIEEGKISFTQKEAAIAVVISVVMVSVVFWLINGTRVQNRDTERISDMTEIRQALRLYFINNGYFPLIPNPVIITGSDAFSKALQNDLVVREVFKDPIHPDFMYTYQSGPKGIQYVLRFCLETDGIQNYSKGCNNTITP